MYIWTNSYVVIMNKGIDTTIWALVVFDSINLRAYRSPSVAFAPLEGRTIISGVYDSLNWVSEPNNTINWTNWLGASLDALEP
jgi:hypothetical protein